LAVNERSTHVCMVGRVIVSNALLFNSEWWLFHEDVLQAPCVSNDVSSRAIVWVARAVLP